MGFWETVAALFALLLLSTGLAFTPKVRAWRRGGGSRGNAALIAGTALLGMVAVTAALPVQFMKDFWAPDLELARTLEQDAEITAISVSEANMRLAAGDQSGDLSVWDMTTGARIAQASVAGSPIRGVSLSNYLGSPVVAYLTDSGEVTFWSTEPDLAPSSFRIPENSVDDAEFVTHRGYRLLLARQGDMLSVWDVWEGKLLRELPWKQDSGHSAFPTELGDSVCLVVGYGQDGSPPAMFLDDGTEIGGVPTAPSILDDPEARNLAVGFADYDVPKVVTAASDRLTVWDLESGAVEADFPGEDAVFADLVNTGNSGGGGWQGDVVFSYHSGDADVIRVWSLAHSEMVGIYHQDVPGDASEPLLAHAKHESTEYFVRADGREIQLLTLDHSIALSG